MRWHVPTIYEIRAISDSEDRKAASRRLFPIRWFMRLYSWLYGYFWLPCPTCDRAFSGCESGGPAVERGMEPSGAWMVECRECSSRRFRLALERRRRNAHAG